LRHESASACAASPTPAILRSPRDRAQEHPMANLASIRCGFYRIPLPVVLSDSTHGEMRAFELNTVRLTDAEGADGVGYTYTAGRMAPLSTRFWSDTRPRFAT
jgi:hypothetical protein